MDVPILHAKCMIIILFLLRYPSLFYFYAKKKVRLNYSPLYSILPKLKEKKKNLYITLGLFDYNFVFKIL